MLRAATILGVTALLSACGGTPPNAKIPTDSVIKGVNYIGAAVSDLERTASFYNGSVDLQSVDDRVISENPLFDTLAGRTGVTVETRLMRSVNAQVRFMNFASPSNQAQAAAQMDVQGPGIAHVCYQVDEKTQAYQKFLAGGARHIGDREMVHLSPDNPVRYAYSRDADGLIAEIEHVDLTKLDRPGGSSNQYRIRHVSLATPDIDRAVEFYEQFLDQPSPRRAGRLLKISGENVDKVSGLEGSELEMAWFQIRNLELEIIQYHSHPTEIPEKPRPVDAIGYNMIVFDVADMDAARKRLVDAGGTVVTEPGPMDGGQIMYGRDPDGNLIGLQVAATDSVYSSQNFKDNGT